MTDTASIAAEKTAARTAAYISRAASHDAAQDAAAAIIPYILAEVAAAQPRARVSGYLPIRDEIDPRPAMQALHAAGHLVCVPLVTGRAQPLAFCAWSPGVALTRGPFGVDFPEGTAPVVPDLLLVPLLAFDAAGYRLGYGGGYYDRTLARLRARGPVRAIGLAYAGQEVARVPVEPTDARLDAVVTEQGVRRPV